MQGGRGRGPPPGRGHPAAGRGFVPAAGAAPPRPAPQGGVPATSPAPGRLPVIFKALAGYTVDVTVRNPMAVRQSPYHR